MTEEWRDVYNRKFPRDHDLFVAGKVRLEDFISQQRKEAAREALEAAAREVEMLLLPIEDIQKNTSDEGEAFDIGGNAGMRRAVSIINKHIEEL